MKLVPVTFVFVLLPTGCGSKGSSPARPQEPLTDEPTLDEPETTPTQPPGVASGSASLPYVRPTGPTLVAGHRDARYEFVVPSGFDTRLRVKVDGADPRELSDAGADGIGPSDDRIGLNSIVLFSDPIGLGIDMRTASAATRERAVAGYGEVLRQRITSATSAGEIAIGPHRAIRVDMSDVVLSGRQPRDGRHYLILDGAVTVSVDCLWTEAYADRMSAACDAVAASLRRVSRD